MSKYRHAKGLSPMQILIIVGIVVGALSIIGGGALAIKHFTSDKVEPTSPTVAATTAETTAPATIDEPATEAVDDDAKYAELAKKHVENMSVDEKIYQMLFATPESVTGVDNVTMAGEQTKAAIEKYPVGGIFYRTENFVDSTQTTDLIKNTQSYSKTPMFIGVADEGKSDSPFSTKLSKTQDELTLTQEDGGKKAFDSASTIAKNISEFGFNFDFAPSANVSGDTKPETVGENASQAVKGFESNSVVSAMKYFPVSADSDKSLDELKTSEFVPFVSAIKDGADVITLSSSKLSSVEDTPVFMSKKVVTDTLLSELKFNGVIITPNLSDSALTGVYDNATLATNSIKAGADILFCPSSIDEYYTAIKAAIDNGEINIAQIDYSVTKILTLKYKYGIISENSQQISNTDATVGASVSETTTETTAETTAETTIETTMQ